MLGSLKSIYPTVAQLSAFPCPRPHPSQSLVQLGKGRIEQSYAGKLGSFPAPVQLPIDNGPHHKSGHLDMLLFQKQALSEAQQTTDLQLTSLLPVEKKGELKEANEVRLI